MLSVLHRISAGVMAGRSAACDGDHLSGLGAKMLNSIRCLTMSRPQPAPPQRKRAEWTWRAAPSIALAHIGKPDPADGGGYPGPGAGWRARQPPGGRQRKSHHPRRRPSGLSPACAALSSFWAGRAPEAGRHEIRRCGRLRDRAWSALEAKFKDLGLKVTQLREDWNHILRRQQGPLAMTPAQEAMMKKAQGARAKLASASAS